MQFLILIPFIAQTLVIIFDELIFHVRRGLPLWERIGHPVDTLSVLACLVFVLIAPYSAINLKWFMALSVFSCLMVTKDEWIHKHHCPAAEHWLHSLLFINHPIMLTSVGLIWAATAGATSPRWITQWLSQTDNLRTFIAVQAVAISVFFLYQVVYWNFIWKEKKQAQ